MRANATDTSTFTITNPVGHVVGFAISDTANWLTVSPENGIIQRVNQVISVIAAAGIGRRQELQRR